MPLMIKPGRFLALILLGASLLGASCGRKAPANPHQVTIRGKTWNVELALTGEQRTMGLAWRKHLPEDAGMLFVFQDARVHEFWMKDCLISLDIAFIGPDRKVAKVYTMYKQPGVPNDKLKLYSSEVPVQYALEVPQGALGRAGVKPGDEVTFSPQIEAAIKAQSWLDR